MQLPMSTAASLLLLAASASGQEPPAAEPARQAPPHETEPTVTMRFPGGTLADFLQRVRAGLPPDTNLSIVASQLCADVQLPAVDLRGAPVLAALAAVAAVVPPPFEVACRREGGDRELVYTVAVRSKPERQADPVDVGVFSLRALTTPQPSDTGATPIALKPETVLSAIELGGKVLGQPLELSYHADSGLLFVHGRREQIGLAKDVLRNLEDDQRKLRSGRKGPQEATAPEKTEGKDVR